MKLLRLAILPAFIFAAASARGHGNDEHAGHGGGQAAEYGEPGDPAAPARVVEVAMREGDGKMLFAPDVVTVEKGEQIRFRLKNEGQLEHEFFLGTPEEIEEHADMMQAVPDMKHNDPNAIRLDTKADGEIIWKFTSEGEFDFVCLIPGHREAGMIGRIVVK